MGKFHGFNEVFIAKERFTSRIILGCDEQRYSRYPHQLGAKFSPHNMFV